MVTPTPALPIISIAPYLPATYADYSDADRAAVAAQFHAACRDVGFLYLNVEGFLLKDDMDEVLTLGTEFFERPQEEKEKIHIGSMDGARGYQRYGENITQGKADHHEGLDLYAANPYEAVEAGAKPRPLQGDNQYPKTPAGLQPALEAWVDKMHVLGEAVMHAMALGLGMDEAEWKAFWKLSNKSFWSMRLIGYPPLPPNADGRSCGEHKDYGNLTFLHTDSTPDALQVLSRSGEWINANPVPGCVVVNIGAMWDKWTGGMYPATLHRVIHKAPTYRVSLPFFFEPNFDSNITLLDAAKRTAAKEGIELVPEPDVLYGDYLLGKVSGNFKY
ncbi:hypothetical protein Q8F55_003308 [Vanrija albida]|uniref:Fe2OG dioxygenase domain-containing protein n=1 Tax=Vanrija albida TaxID=181172 RepID=A0ABR3Q3W0_9TREE